ncbi:carbohydrate kinase family protein [Paenibacillus sp. S150]|uniref:carbohydrate kinase family protein n=1 Tax=Paenibacillus sp. S150 TaxID=2749826 RepID=UPI001C571F4D|nr:carbohydrate kinase family protein [Paenibacillus sp. S150]MBW4083098.1 carbohydrate kinase family protein [Paenibacillus sp. S150]
MVQTVIGIGDLTLDIFLPQLERLPEWGLEVMIDEPRRQLGGNIGNMAIGAAALAAPFVSCGFIGSDQEGGFLKEQFKRLNLSMDGLREHRKERTSQTFACIRKDGERFFLTYPGVLNQMEELFADIALPPGNIVFLSGWCLPPRVSPNRLNELIRMWRGEGRWIAADLIWSDETWMSKADLLEVLLQCDAVFMNTDELAAFTDSQDLQTGITRLRRWIATAREPSAGKLFIIKKGKEGAAAVGAELTCEVKAIAIEAEHTVGAGDLFNISFLHARWNRNKTIEEALRFACTFAGLSIRKKGSGIPTESEVNGQFSEGGGSIE